MKKSVITTALIAGFLSVAGTSFATGKSVQPSCPPPGVTAAVDAPPSGSGMRPDPGLRLLSFRQKLGLSERQESKMVGISQNFFRQSRTVIRDIRELKHELAVESVRKSPDKRKIEALSRKIGLAYVRMSEIESRNLHDIATVLDAKQLDTFMKMKEAHQARRLSRS